MFERLVQEARGVIGSAEHEARALGASTIEAEHLLLALAADAHSPTSDLLEQAGLDHAGVLDALERETERSLAVVGVQIGEFRFAPAARRHERKPRFAASSRRALERALEIAAARGARRIAAPHLLLGILDAQLGTVPRALAVAEVDPVALAISAGRLLD